MRMFTRITTDQRGATAIEYSLVATLISIAAIVGYSNLGNKVETSFNNVNQTLANTI